MKKIEWFWNLMHYNIFIFENKVSSLILYPFLKFLQLNSIKKAYKKRGVVNIDEIVKNAIMNPNNGSNTSTAGAIIGIISLLWLFGFFHLYTGLFLTKLNMSVYVLILLLVIVFATNYIFLFKDNLYVEYFKQFAMMPKHKKIIYGWITFFFIVLTITFLILSFIYMNYLLH
jgi:hypothetical protein